ncbi:MMPL family transporter [Campylobacter sp. MIT 21-1685]|uniref:efflux RND transporter permease subunit n=1 Tax=unclassified Campylobacter TaxID=2593542 RepID=UPI00224B461C|nr:MULTISPECIES: MMPL family transporter [unclassified Campylobacter]MCX2683179.1 MMPL family transporter [Campylobacter sp. MIT 21-1684]MCX2751501.1 MMPL family transporter [Campylobacter sp. MIT 21-1682]MCX2807660.1 MMPL family transporter [Campylobacter sp. MIT 21-1685]
MLSKLLRFCISYPKSTLLLTLFCTLSLSFFAPNLTIDASAESLLLENDKDLKRFRELSEHYKNDNFLLLAFKPQGKLFSLEKLKKLEKLHKELQSVPQVMRVFSIINAPLLQSGSTNDVKELLRNIPTLMNQDINQSKAQKEILTSPFYKNNIISKDGTIAGLLIYLMPDEKYTELLKKRDEAMNENQKDYYRLAIKTHKVQQQLITKESLQTIKNILKNFEKDGDKLYLGGVSMVADDMISSIKSDLVLYGFSLIFLLAFALYYFFRTWRFVFLPLLICFLSLTAVSGTFALLGFEITIVSSNYVALMLIITLSVVIHLITHFIESSQKHRYSKVQRILLQTLLAKSKPSFYAIVTTMVGFCSLILSHIEPIIKLGIMMSIALIFSLVLSYLFLASSLVLLKPQQYKQKKFDLSFLQWCVQTCLQTPKRRFIYIVALVALIVSLFGISKLRVENSFVNYFKDGSEVKKGLLVLDKNLGGTLSLDLILHFPTKETKKEDDLNSFENEFENLASQQTYWFDSKKTRLARKVHEFLEKKQFIGSVLSLNSLLLLGKNINNGKDLDDFSLAFLNENLPSNFKEELLSPYVSIENNELRFVMRIQDSDPNLHRDEFLKNLHKELEELLRNEGVQFELTGVMLLYNNMLQSLFSSQFNTLIFVVGVIFILFCGIFRSLKLSLIALVVNVVPLSVVFALMGLCNIALDIMSITIAAITLGIGVDDAVHYIYRFKEERKTKNTEDALLASHLGIGSALYYTTFSIVLGFSVMMSSDFIPTIYFGILTVFVMISLLIGSLFLLPSLLFSFYKTKKSID